MSIIVKVCCYIYIYKKNYYFYYCVSKCAYKHYQTFDIKYVKKRKSTPTEESRAEKTILTLRERGLVMKCSYIIVVRKTIFCVSTHFLVSFEN